MQMKRGIRQLRSIGHDESGWTGAVLLLQHTAAGI